MQHSIKMAEHSVSLAQHATQNGYLPGRMLLIQLQMDNLASDLKRITQINHAKDADTSNMCSDTHLIKTDASVGTAALVHRVNNTTTLCGDSSETELVVWQQATCTAWGGKPVRHSVRDSICTPRCIL